MRLITAHKVLIGFALALALLMAMRSAMLYGRSRRADDLVFGLAEAALALGLAGYLRSMRGR
jgi:hypothetical protein